MMLCPHICEFELVGRHAARVVYLQVNVTEAFHSLVADICCARAFADDDEVAVRPRPWPRLPGSGIQRLSRYPRLMPLLRLMLTLQPVFAGSQHRARKDWQGGLLLNLDTCDSEVELGLM